MSIDNNSSFMKKKPNNFAPLNDLLKKELKRFAHGKMGTTLSIEKQWKKIVGDTISNNTKILYAKKQILYVKVSHSAWMQELGFMKTKILDDLNKSLKDSKIEDIKFKI